jgi:pseudouridine-5'-monophosphatase
MDGLLLNTEDLYTLAINTILHRHNRPTMPWTLKARLQGRPGPSANKLMSEWAQFPVPEAKWQAENAEEQKKLFPSAAPLPGVEDLLEKLGGCDGVEVALATSSHGGNFRLKAGHLEELFSVFPQERRVLGDDTRIPPGRGKPLPDIFLLALQTINDTLPAGTKPITPEECLVFEDSVPGVEAGRRAGMRVVWCPHPKLREVYEGREEEILAGRRGEAEVPEGEQGGVIGEIGDGWAEFRETLEAFDYGRYGIRI